MDFIINRIFRDLIPLNYNIDIKYINSYKDFFGEKFNIIFVLVYLCCLINFYSFHSFGDFLIMTQKNKS